MGRPAIVDDAQPRVTRSNRAESSPISGETKLMAGRACPLPAPESAMRQTPSPTSLYTVVGVSPTDLPKDEGDLQ